MDEWRTDGLSMRQGKTKVVSIKKSNVAQVAMLIGKSRKRRATYAFLIVGAVASGLTGAAYASSDCCEVPTAAVAAGAAVFWGGIAAATAASFPQHHEMIYSAPASSGPSGAGQPQKESHN